MSAIVGNVPFFSQFIRHCFQTSSLASFENKFCRKSKTVPFSQWQWQSRRSTHFQKRVGINYTAWKVSKYVSKSPYSVQIQENTDQKKLRIWLDTFHAVLDINLERDPGVDLLYRSQWQFFRKLWLLPYYPLQFVELFLLFLFKSNRFTSNLFWNIKLLSTHPLAKAVTIKLNKSLWNK